MDQDLTKTAKVVGNVASQYFDTFMVVGFDLSGRSIAFSNIRNAKDAMAIQSSLERTLDDLERRIDPGQD